MPSSTMFWLISEYPISSGHNHSEEDIPLTSMCVLSYIHYMVVSNTLTITVT